MISLSAEATAVLTGSWVMHTRVESWLGEEQLAEDVPISSGVEETDRSLSIPERVTITVPRIDRGVTWDASGDSGHPLAPFGQRLKVSIGVEIGNGVIEWLQRGWFLVTNSSTDADSVSVQAQGLLTLIDEARFVSPFQPSGTFKSTIRSLVEPALTVDFDSSLTDRSVPSNMSWDEDRLGGLQEILDAWPADAHVTPDGYLAVVPATESTTVVGSLTNGLGGTVVHWGGASTRDDASSLVVARGQASDGSQVQGVAYELTGPTAFGSSFNPLPVPTFFFSPLLTTNAQCRAAATSIVSRRRRSNGRRLMADAVPNPAYQVGDLISVTTDDLTDESCLIESLSIPLTPQSGSMQATLRVVD